VSAAVVDTESKDPYSAENNCAADGHFHRNFQKTFTAECSPAALGRVSFARKHQCLVGPGAFAGAALSISKNVTVAGAFARSYFLWNRMFRN
jgi:hypothetical protein